MFFTENEFLDINECDYIISRYLENQHLSFQYNQTRPICVRDIRDELIDSVISQIHRRCENFIEDSLVIDNAEIVRWNIDSYMDKHIDPDTDELACILYLNDDYQGGYTCFEGNQVQPKKGKLLGFRNSIYEHWVTEVKEKERFTLVVWFVKAN